MRVTYQYSPEWKKLILSGSNIIKQFPAAQKKTVQDTVKIIFTEADRKVHVVTGRTKRSGAVKYTSDNQAVITYEFGGVWEERRGGDHAFLHEATQKGSKEMARIAQKYITEAVQKGL